MLVLVSTMQGQTLAEKVAENTCAHLETIDDLNTLEDSLQAKIAIGMAEAMIDGSDEDRTQLGNIENIRSILKEVQEMLPSYCYHVRRLIIESRKAQFYKKSDNVKANERFEKGNDFMKKGDFKKAEKEFKAAVKLDDKFVYAIDHLAVAYRRQEEYQSALKYYKQSLEIFPEGDLALLNIAVVYTLLQDYENTTKNYEKLKYLYPDNPEGYFGLARMYFLSEDYEKALDNLFLAHRIYVATESNYVKDSAALLSIMFAKLKTLDKTDLITQKAKEYNVNIDMKE